MDCAGTKSVCWCRWFGSCLLLLRLFFLCHPVHIRPDARTELEFVLQLGFLFWDRMWPYLHDQRASIWSQNMPLHRRNLRKHLTVQVSIQASFFRKRAFSLAAFRISANPNMTGRKQGVTVNETGSLRMKNNSQDEDGDTNICSK